MQYRYGEGFRDIEKINVSVPLSSDEATERTVYMTHYGPILVSEQLHWTNDKAYAMRDAILDNNATTKTYEALQVATSVADVEAAISKQGVMFVNTIAADRQGNAFYADISSTPNVTTEMLQNCRKPVDGLPPYILVLDGSDAACEWSVDPRSSIRSIHAAAFPAICPLKICQEPPARTISQTRTTATGSRIPMRR
jgi:acyl-homoserine-lactone acylase